MKQATSLLQRSPKPPQLALRSIQFRFDRRQEWLFNNFSIEVASGEIVALMGRSGTGKSTLLRLMVGLEQLTGGELVHGDNSNPGPCSCRAMVFQGGTLMPWLTVQQNTMLGLRFQKMEAGLRRQLASQQLESVDMLEWSHAYPHQLSGGMQQRVELARALILNPVTLLLDEPFSALDADARSELGQLVVKLARERGTTVILATHSLEEAESVADRIIQLERRPEEPVQIAEMRWLNRDAASS